MGKRSRDLFSLLEDREQNRTTEGRTSQGGETRPRRAAPAAEGFWASLRQMFGAPDARPAGRGRAAAAGLPGIVLVAVALAFLGVGYGLGRWLPRADAGGQDLAARGGGQPQPQVQEPRRPGPLAATPGQLSPEKEAEILSNAFFMLLQFGAPQAEEAVRAAAYLRAQGVETARARKFQTAVDKTEIWAVIAYVVANDVAGTLGKLKVVPPSRVWPRLTALIPQLRPESLQYTTDPAGR